MKRLLALLALCLPVVAAASPTETVAAQFVDVLRRDDPATATRFMITDAPTPAWIDLRELVSRFDCINVLRYEATLVSEASDALTLRVDLVGSAELKAERRPQRPLPKTWHIDARRVDGEWRATRVITEERRVALAMFDAPSEAEAERVLLAAPHVDARDVLPHYAAALEFAKIPRRYERVEHAAEMARRMADVSTEIQVLRKHVDPLTRANDPRALDVARRVEALAHDVSATKDDLAWALLIIGLVRLRTEGLAAASVPYGACAAAANDLDDPTTAIKCAQMHFTVEVNLGLMKGLVPIERIEALSQRYRWEEGRELVLADRTIVHHELGDLDRVRSVMVELMALAERHGNRRTVKETMHNLAAVEMRAGNDAAAVKLLRAVIARFGGEGQLYSVIAGALIATGELDEAEVFVHRAEADRGGMLGCAQLAPRRARIHMERGHPHLAIAQTTEVLHSLDLSHGWSDSHVTTGALALRAQAFRSAGRLADAELDLRSVIEIVDNRREEIGGDALTRALVAQDYAYAHVELVEILVQREQIEEAFRVADQMKARGLRHVVGGRRVDGFTSMSAEERAREDALEKNVVALNREVIQARQAMAPLDSIEAKLDVARRDLDTFRTEMRLKYPTVARRRADQPMSSLALPAGSDPQAVIEYVVAESQVLAFVLTRDAIHVERLPLPREQVEREAREVAERVAARSPAYATAAKRLYASLLAPLEKHLRGVKALAIIPDGALWLVPFHALIEADGAHVVDRRAVFYAHSLSLLNTATSTMKTTETRLLAFGNPSIGATTQATLRSAHRDAALGSLEAAEEEVQSLSTMYTPQRSRVFFREQAKEAVFKNEAPRYSILHLAAHAIVNDGAPMYSAIVLAQSGEASDEGLLEAREVVDLPLNAELAVLSACETARGKVGAGEGMIGLPWAFFAAGVPTTIVSQWNAESSATAKLMVELHRRLLAGATVADALRAAQLSVRKMPRYRHPFYWAPFVAIGAAGRGLASP